MQGQQVTAILILLFEQSAEYHSEYRGKSTDRQQHMNDRPPFPALFSDSNEFQQQCRHEQHDGKMHDEWMQASEELPEPERGYIGQDEANRIRQIARQGAKRGWARGG